MSKVKQSNSERFVVQVDATDVKRENSKDDKSENPLKAELVELFNTITNAYSEQLKVFSDEKVRMYGLQISEREAIANMITQIVRRRRVGEVLKELYDKKEVDMETVVKSGQGNYFKILYKEFRLADLRSGKYFWIDPSVFEFCSRFKDIATKEINKSRGDLVVFIGLKFLDKYSSEMQNKYHKS